MYSFAIDLLLSKSTFSPSLMAKIAFVSFSNFNISPWTKSISWRTSSETVSDGLLLVHAADNATIGKKINPNPSKYFYFSYYELLIFK